MSDRLLFLLAVAAILVSGQVHAQDAPKTKPRGLYIMQSDGTNVRRLVSKPVEGVNFCGTPSWSRDGTRIAFDACNDANWSLSHIYVVHVAGDQRGLIEDLGPGVSPEWSPDGTELALLLHSGMIPDKRGGVYVKNLESGELRSVGSYIRCRWSPNGEFLIASNAYSGKQQLRIVDLREPGRWAIELEGFEFMTQPVFQDEATRVNVLAQNGTGLHLLSLNISAQPPEILRDVPIDGKPFVTMGVSTDGSTVIGARGTKLPGELRLVRCDLRKEPAELVEIEPDLPKAQSCDPCFSPDGAQVVFASNREGEWPPYFEPVDAKALKLLKPQSDGRR